MTDNVLTRRRQRWRLPTPCLPLRAVMVLGAVVLSICSSGLLIAEETGVSPRTTAPTGLSAGDMITVILGLLFVIGLIFALAWIVRRFNGSPAVNSRVIKVLAVTPLGAKEKLVLVAIGKQQLLLGVTAHQITQLTELDEPLDLTTHPEGSPFARQLGALLGGKQANPSSRGQKE
ncbi:MAG: flagellar biosynthetic protein FliO [Natronospirillum sp.]|uniref:flagellar biosynthetic protein FliO n=1 Tax=Natronospirillum sp. TaxID=2812955 RepID=UPI0025D12B72|nr:flagellar biosynthetic protein FliO [Natronospirillum sp.]MCH8551283.1 flagellar biosynthetic protein FliO [Natronospirillum sp.]